MVSGASSVSATHRPDEVRRPVELLGERRARDQHRHRAAARRPVPGGGLLARLEVDVRGSLEHADRKAEVLRGGPVVQGQPLGPADDADAELGQRHPLAVDALVGVLGDEQVIRVLAN